MVTLEGEVVRDLKPIIGYVHTGIEKTVEDKSYWKAIPVVERMDYLAYYFNAYAFCGAVETLLDLEVPKRAQYLRVIHLELNRIKSHLVWLGTSALDLGAISMFWYCFREREQVLDLFEMSSGQRMHTRYIQVGGVAEDIPPGWIEKCRAFTQTHAPSARDEYGALLNRNEIVLQRLRNVEHRARRSGCSSSASPARCCAPPACRGTCARPQPYSLLRGLRLQDPGRHDRRQLRPLRGAPRRSSTSPATSSTRRSTTCPTAAYIADDRKVVLPPRHELATSMEALIHHFKLVTEGYRVPPGEVYFPIESPRGELGASCAPTARPSPRACTCATRRS